MFVNPLSRWRERAFHLPHPLLEKLVAPNDLSVIGVPDLHPTGSIVGHVPAALWRCYANDQAEPLLLEVNPSAQTPAEGYLIWLSKPRTSSLLVVHCGAAEFLALRIGSACGDSAGLAISRHDDSTSGSNFGTLLDRELQGPQSADGPTQECRECGPKIFQQLRTDPAFRVSISGFSIFGDPDLKPRAPARV